MENTFHQTANPAAPAQAGGATETISGVIESIVYRAEDTGYTVCRAKIPKTKDPVTVVGNCSAIWSGEDFKAEGRWVNHKQHGFQFQADSFVCSPPATAKGIERFLASGLIKGIGKVTAQRLVKVFGADTLRIIEKESQKLEEVNGIGPHRRRMIKDSWNEHNAVRDIMIFLQGHEVGIGQAVRIHRQYGGEAIDRIRENPYRLCSEVWGIGFKTADKIAMSLGVPPHSELRARAGIAYTLETMSEDGHCFCPADSLAQFGSEMLDIPLEIVQDALNHEVEKKNLVHDADRIYLPELHRAETGVASGIRRLLKSARNFPAIVVDKAIPWAEYRMGISFDPMQSNALRMALTEKVSIITGGPGVGKTTIIRALVDIFKARKLRVLLAAPTGRASKRMEEATGNEAMTVHRLLKFMPSAALFEQNASNPIEGDVFILDEVSMVDVLLMKAFLDALPDTATLALVGDVDQLPSVGPGNVLKDLIDCGAIKSARLETIFRQESGGLIVQNAHRVNHGESILLPEGEELSDFYFFPVNEPDEAIRRVVELLQKRIPGRFGFDPMNDIQLLTPMRKNQLGADNLNVVIQDILNPEGQFIPRFGRKYRIGDRVMQIRNNYDKEVFNGDIGRIVKIDGVDQVLVVDYDGRRVNYDFAEIDELVHAYACSIHKSQGSEYPAVVILITTQHFKLLQRNLLYTAITRGRKLVCLVGSWKAVNMAIRNNKIRLRRTGLREMLVVI